MPSSNASIARIFQEMADLLEITGGNRFKVNAFAKAARVVGELPRDVASIDRQMLPKLEGIGSGTADRIAEFLDTGQIADHQALIAEVPEGLLAVMGVPGVGPKSAAVLWKQGGVESIEQLKEKLGDGSLEAIKGFGKKKLANIEKSLKFAEASGHRTRLGDANRVASAIAQVLREIDGVQRVEVAGSLRRGRETIGDLDLLVLAAPKLAEAVFQRFTSLDLVDEVLVRGDTKCSVRTVPGAGGMQVDVRLIDPSGFGAAWMYFTGSKDHNVRMRERAIEQGLSLNEYALTKDGKAVAGATEQEVFEKLGLAWVPPELREDRGELKLAEAGRLPDLIDLKDIKAELHTHTTASDGRWSIRDLALAAADRGFHTVAITDHSKGQVQANGLNEDRLVKHIEAIRNVAAELKETIRVLAGSEVDILSDGRLDYPDALLAELDVVVASPHASLAQEPSKATARLLKAIENPYVTIMGHPTGRLVGRREGLSPDMDELCKAAADRGIAMEINANQWRLDLRDTHARLAVEEHGCKIAINTDAHGEGDLDQLMYGVLTARRAGLTKNDVVNCMSQAQLKKWIDSTRPA
jgi:DNA polymerase (family 10)